MVFNKRLCSILTVTILIFTLFNISSATSVNNSLDKTDDKDFNGFIIQFKEEPVISFKSRIVEKTVNLVSEIITEYKEKLISIHNRAKQEISAILGLDDSSKGLFSTEFYDLFNGICIKNIEDDDIRKIKNLDYVKDVTPNYKIYINLEKSVPLIGANEIWNYHDKNGKSLTGNGVKIAIIDTGVNYNHPDLRDNYVGGYDFVNNDNDPMDDHGHGTHCAGIALGSGEFSNYKIVGVAPQASLYSYKVMNSNGEGDVSYLLSAMQQAAEDDVDIISLSLGNKNSMASPDSLLCQAADDAVEAGIIVVAAAGNDGEEGPISSPGCARKVICVGATDNYDNIASFSSRGPVYLERGGYIIKPDVVAPGISIKSCSLLQGYTTNSGTSMATPHVAGSAAIVLQNNPDLTPQQVKTILKENSVDLGLDENVTGSGRINISASIRFDDEYIIKSPYRISEKERFEVTILDNKNNPINAIIFVWNPMHLPRLKFGSSVTIFAPIIIGLFKSKRTSKIYIINLRSGFVKKVDIMVTNG
jgi:subtilisin family serine protease